MPGLGIAAKGVPVMDSWDDLLWVLTVLEGAVCLVGVYIVVLLAPYGVHHLRLPLTLFAGAACALLVTAAIADVYHGIQGHHRRHR